jgi:hypothetical protein
MKIKFKIFIIIFFCFEINPKDSYTINHLKKHYGKDAFALIIIGVILYKTKGIFNQKKQTSTKKPEIENNLSQINLNTNQNERPNTSKSNKNEEVIIQQINNKNENQETTNKINQQQQQEKDQPESELNKLINNDKYSTFHSSLNNLDWITNIYIDPEKDPQILELLEIKKYYFPSDKQDENEQNKTALRYIGKKENVVNNNSLKKKKHKNKNKTSQINNENNQPEASQAPIFPLDNKTDLPKIAFGFDQNKKLNLLIIFYLNKNMDIFYNILKIDDIGKSDFKKILKSIFHTLLVLKKDDKNYNEQSKNKKQISSSRILNVKEKIELERGKEQFIENQNSKSDSYEYLWEDEFLDYYNTFKISPEKIKLNTINSKNYFCYVENENPIKFIFYTKDKKTPIYSIKFYIDNKSNIKTDEETITNNNLNQKQQLNQNKIEKFNIGKEKLINVISQFNNPQYNEENDPIIDAIIEKRNYILLSLKLMKEKLENTNENKNNVEYIPIHLFNKKGIK